MGQITDIKAGNRGCQFNDRFNFESISSTKTMNMVVFNCLNAESDGKKYLNETYANNHAYFESQVEKPNQTDPEYITYDLSCNEDFALHAKFYDWQRIFEFFKILI